MVCRESQFLVGFYTVSLNQCKSIQNLNATSAGKEGKSNEDRFQERMDTLEYK